jgi:opacity protein-like surface antigen
VRRILAGLTVGLALCAAPAFAANVSGLYAGIYAGGSVRNDAQFDYDSFGAVLTDSGTIRTPTGFINDGVDPALFEALNAGLVQYPFADGTPGVGAAGGFLVDGTLSFNSSLTLGVVVGYGLGNGFRVEADASAMSFSSGLFTAEEGFSAFVNGAIDGSGVWTWSDDGGFPVPGPPPPPAPLEDDLFAYKSDVQFLLVNGFYDIDTGSAFTPYLGAGLGVARVSATLTDLCSCSGDSFSASTIVPAAQIGAGIRIAVSDPVTFDIGYRYKMATSPDLGVYEIMDNSVPGFPGFGGFGMTQSGIIGVHALQAGLTFALN